MLDDKCSKFGTRMLIREFLVNFLNSAQLGFGLRKGCSVVIKVEGAIDNGIFCNFNHVFPTCQAMCVPNLAVVC